MSILQQEFHDLLFSRLKGGQELTFRHSEIDRCLVVGINDRQRCLESIATRDELQRARFPSDFFSHAVEILIDEFNQAAKA
jgi:hypothetical protein